MCPCFPSNDQGYAYLRHVEGLRDGGLAFPASVPPTNLDNVVVGQFGESVSGPTCTPGLGHWGSTLCNATQPTSLSCFRRERPTMTTPAFDAIGNVVSKRPNFEVVGVDVEWGVVLVANHKSFGNWPIEHLVRNAVRIVALSLERERAVVIRVLWAGPQPRHTLGWRLTWHEVSKHGIRAIEPRRSRSCDSGSFPKSWTAQRISILPKSEQMIRAVPAALESIGAPAN